MPFHSIFTFSISKRGYARTPHKKKNQKSHFQCWYCVREKNELKIKDFWRFESKKCYWDFSVCPALIILFSIFSPFNYAWNIEKELVVCVLLWLKVIFVFHFAGYKRSSELKSKRNKNVCYAWKSIADDANRSRKMLKHVLIMSDINWVTFKHQVAYVKLKRSSRNWYLERSTVTQSEQHCREFRKSKKGTRSIVSARSRRKPAAQWGPFGPLHCFTSRSAFLRLHL